MIKEIVFKAEFVDQQDIVDKINECVRALNNLESLITSHNISRDAMSRSMEAPVRSDDTRHPY
jgi:hypothetical protein